MRKKVARKKKNTIKQRMLALPKLMKGGKNYVIRGKFAGVMGKDGRHVAHRYTAKENVEKDGKVIIELTPYKELEERRKELVEKLAPIFAEKLDNKELMKDILSDVTVDSLERLDTAVDRGAKITPDHCFGFKLKDPRMKKSYRLPIRK